ncbi:MAG TPA: cation diffusion facilitator family transporter [Burkholderiales bacterium]|nr:cation diffusion facilitator family transporter [Burkholderiales bacterium]
MKRHAITPAQALALSLTAALAIVALKWGAWWTTGSVGFLSDALHSLVNVAGAGFAWLMVLFARRPPSAAYPFGYGKAEYFSAAFEGGLIAAAAAGILFAVGERIAHPHVLAPLGTGTGLSVLAACLNLAVARVLIRVGRAHHSLATEGDGRHLMADVWITAGVILGVGAAGLTGWLWLDIAAALLVAVNLIRVGWLLVSRSLAGLLDAAWPGEDIERMQVRLRALESQGASFGPLRTRRSGAWRFATVELRVSPGCTVERADAIAKSAEREASEEGAALLVRIVPADA